MCNAPWPRLLAAACIAVALGPAAFAPSGQGADDTPSVTFVRDGLVLHGGPGGESWSAPRLDGEAVAVRPFPEGAWFVERSWRPRESLELSWRAGPITRKLAITAPLRPTPWAVWQRPWASGAEPRSAVSAMAFSPDGTLLAVGGMDGNLRLLESAAGETIWETRRPGRVVRDLAFSPDGARLFVGEQGPEGRIAAYAVGSESTEPLWRFDTAGELGTSRPVDPGSPWGWVTYPGTYRLLARDGYVLAAATHSWSRAGRRVALGRLYRLDGTTGAIAWGYPLNGPLSQMITWFAVNELGEDRPGRIALPLQLPAGAVPRSGGGEESRVVVLAEGSGATLFAHTVPPEPPHRSAAFWRGVALAPEGSRLAAASEDGRGFLFAEEGGAWRLIRRLRLVEPLRMGDLTVTATNGTLAAVAEGPLFVTGPTYLPREFPQGEGQPMADHPQGNTLFAFDWGGEPRWLWRLEADLMGLAMDDGGDLLALAEGREEHPTAASFQGMEVLAPRRSGAGRERFVYRYAVEGRVVYNGIAVSPDGRWIALAEAPLIDPARPEPRGAHRIHLLR